MVIDHVADRGFLDPHLLYSSPFNDLSAKGVDGLFPPDQVNALFAIVCHPRECEFDRVVISPSPAAPSQPIPQYFLHPLNHLPRPGARTLPPPAS